MSGSDKRDSRRVILKGPAVVRFQAAGRLFDRIPMANLSHGGCLAMVPFEDAGALCIDAPVRELMITYPGMPANPIVARVAWTMAHAEGDQVAVGLQFQEMTSDTRIALVALVDAVVLQQPR
ncbi:MAG TPA: PilZ domain-containing protein [Holophagaceae bacterium]|jgi:hypothetical protein|nr:PilZ domain-containing protein [Holophagaceae bacterium]